MYCVPAISLTIQQMYNFFSNGEKMTGVWWDFSLRDKKSRIRVQFAGRRSCHKSCSESEIIRRNRLSMACFVLLVPVTVAVQEVRLCSDRPGCFYGVMGCSIANNYLCNSRWFTINSRKSTICWCWAWVETNMPFMWLTEEKKFNTINTEIFKTFFCHFIK